MRNEKGPPIGSRQAPAKRQQTRQESTAARSAGPDLGARSPLVRYEQARAALANASRVDEVKDIRDKAQALAAYARQAKDNDLIAWATEIKVRAERRAGEMLAVVERHQGKRTDRTSDQRGPKSLAEVIRENNVAPTTAKRWQKLAAIPEEEFEHSVAATKEVMGEVTTAAILSQAHARKMSQREQERKDALHRPVELVLPNGIMHGDFRELSAQIPDDSIDLIFTDPPYDSDSVELYGDIARIAARILKPGASLIAYSGQRYLLNVGAVMVPHLRYWWTCAVIHGGGNQMLQKLGIRCGWKPLVWYVKGTRGDVQNIVADTVRGEREKFAHAWQQAEVEAEYFIGKLTGDRGVVVDFCLGGGTTAAAAKKLDRRFIGFEIDDEVLSRAVARLAGMAR